MKALTVRQPHAWHIIQGKGKQRKDIENRPWNTKVRGTIAIHAGGELDKHAEIPKGKDDDLVRSHIIGVVDLVDVVEEHDSAWFEGDYGFVLKNPRKLPEPIPCKGQLRFWNVPPEIEEQIQKQLDFTIYSFGYWGWGTHAQQLVEVVDAAEKAAGFKPPLWIDIRLKRQGRARDFVGTAFENIVGADRYCWMPRLGNANIGTDNPGIKIAQPEAVSDLLDAALEAAQQNRRVLFFCACKDLNLCHRRVVAELLKKEARRRRIPLRVPDWLGA